jgi:hypothetical protein
MGKEKLFLAAIATGTSDDIAEALALHSDG